MDSSDVRCAALDFALGLYEPPCRDGGGADGDSLVFRDDPCTRAASHTPPRPCGVAFAVTWAARPSGC